MNIEVTMASGESDEWADVADAIDTDGTLVVVDDLEEGETDVKTMTMTERVKDPAPTAPVNAIYVPTFSDHTTVFKVLAVYAPGMWIKVEYT